MAAIPIAIAEDRKAVQYDGSNSAELATLIDDFTVVSENATTLTFTSLGTTRTVPVNGWVTYWQGAVREATFANDDDFRDVYRNLEEMVHVHDLKLTTSVGRAPQPGEEA